MNTLTKRSVAALVAGSALIGSFALTAPAFAAETAGAKPAEAVHTGKSVTGAQVRTDAKVRTVKAPEKKTMQKPARAPRTVKAPKAPSAPKKN